MCIKPKKSIVSEAALLVFDYIAKVKLLLKVFFSSPHKSSTENVPRVQSVQWFMCLISNYFANKSKTEFNHVLFHRLDNSEHKNEEESYWNFFPFIQS